MEIEFLESVLESYTTPEITNLFSSAFDIIERGVEENLAKTKKSGKLDSMYASVKVMMEESRANTRTQFCCFH
jgi:hypothetical protein